MWVQFCIYVKNWLVLYSVEFYRTYRAQRPDKGGILYDMGNENQGFAETGARGRPWGGPQGRPWGDAGNWHQSACGHTEETFPDIGFSHPNGSRTVWPVLGGSRGKNETVLVQVSCRNAFKKRL